MYKKNTFCYFVIKPFNKAQPSMQKVIILICLKSSIQTYKTNTHFKTFVSKVELTPPFNAKGNCIALYMIFYKDK